MAQIQRRPFIFCMQWHITARCDQHCKHCYMYDYPTYRSEIKNQQNYEDCLEIIDDFSNMVDRLGIRGRINFTGGDPLLRRDFFKLINHAKSKDLLIGILGNPNHITEKIAMKLKDIGIFRYQISIDGLEKTHDELRGKKGAFKTAIRAIRILNKSGIPTVVMFTLSKRNSNELIEVIRLCAKENVSVFDFARLVPIGTGKGMKDDMIIPYEYRELLLKVFYEYKRLREKGQRTFFGKKDYLWNLLYQDLGLLPKLPEDNETIFDGCSIGSHSFVVLADGKVVLCRRLPIVIGEVPKEKIWDIFINSKEINKFRDLNNFKKCKGCDLRQFCRGCPAVAYGVSGDQFNEDPQCWKGVDKQNLNRRR